jgi:hypothetical protein
MALKNIAEKHRKEDSEQQKGKRKQNEKAKGNWSRKRAAYRN